MVTDVYLLQFNYFQGIAHRANWLYANHRSIQLLVRSDTEPDTLRAVFQDANSCDKFPKFHRDFGVLPVSMKVKWMALKTLNEPENQKF